MSEPLRNQRDLLREALGRTPECPALDVLASPKHQKHLAGCPHCRAELALLHQFENAQAQPGEAADLAWIQSTLAHPARQPATSREPFGNRLREWFAFLLVGTGRGRLSLAAAGLLILVTAGVFLRPGTGLRPGRIEEPTVWRSGQFAAASPVGDLDHAPSQLRWEAVYGAASYHVRLLEVDGTEIWSADSAAASVDFPGNIARQLTPGRAFQWDVAARDGAGRVMATTNLQTFHILATRRSR